MDLNILEIEDLWQQDKICVYPLKDEIKDLVWNLGGPAKAAKAIEVKYSRLKEWSYGRRPIPLSNLKELLSKASDSLASEVKARVGSKPIFLKVQRSKFSNLKVPNCLSSDLAYIVGLLLGDGYLAGDVCNAQGNWVLSVFFDNHSHMQSYRKKILSLFGLMPAYYFSGGCYCCYFGSKAVHWFLRAFFKMPNGKKSSRIVIPERILYCEDMEVVFSCIRGLFDTDGTVSSNRVSFSSTSEVIVDQIRKCLGENGIITYKDSWLKSEHYKWLYTVRVSKNSLFNFAKFVGFSHPVKKKKLNTLLNNF